MPIVNINGSDLHVFEHAVADASTPPLVLLHGAGGQYAVWPPQVRRLAEIHTLAPDLPGHGRSRGAPRHRIDDYAADVLALADALTLDRFVVAGLSMGGAIAMQIALDAPERVAELIVVSAGAQLPIAGDLLELLEDDPWAAVEMVATRSFGPQADDAIRKLGRRLLQSIPPDVLAADYHACAAFDARARLAEITAPTLVLAGSDDAMLPPGEARCLAEGLPNAEFRLIEGTGHLIPAEFPGETAAAMRSWLERHVSA
jgi:pimeloyl-ACP methyl ester carboxylesterase